MYIEHIAIFTRNLERLKEFYGHYFGFEAGERYLNNRTQFESYFLSTAAGARLEIMHRPELPERVANNGDLTGFSHFAFCLGSEEKVIELFNRLKGDGYQVVSAPRTTGDGYFEACINDPDGNRIEISA